MKKKLAALGVVLLCLLSQRPHAQSPAPGHAGIYFIDIGQGASTLIVSPVAHKPSLNRMGVETDQVVNVGSFAEGQRPFLDYHRNAVLLRAMR